MSRTPSGLCRLVWPWLPSGQKRGKTKMSCTPSGLAVAVIGKNKRKHEKCHACHLVWPWLVTHTIWSGHDCHQAKRKEKQKMSRMPSGLPVAVISKKKEKRKMSRTLSGLALFANGPKF